MKVASCEGSCCAKLLCCFVGRKAKSTLDRRELIKRAPKMTYISPSEKSLNFVFCLNFCGLVNLKLWAAISAVCRTWGGLIQVINSSIKPPSIMLKDKVQSAITWVGPLVPYGAHHDRIPWNCFPRWMFREILSLSAVEHLNTQWYSNFYAYRQIPSLEELEPHSKWGSWCRNSLPKMCRSSENDVHTINKVNGILPTKNVHFAPIL